MPVPAKSAGEARYRTLLRDHVRQQIRDAILDGTLRPGERLHDDELTEWLGVSRTPIREALTHLAGSGLIETCAQRYTRVAEVRSNDVLPALQTLGVLFSGVARTATPSLDDAQAGSIVADIDAALAHVDGDRIGEAAFASPAGYDRWLEVCDNPQLADTCRKSIDGLAFRLRHARLEIVLSAEETAEELHALRAAVVGRDGVAAQAAMRRLHLLD